MLPCEISEIHCKEKSQMSPSKPSDKAASLRFLQSRRKKAKQQGSEKSPSEQIHAQDKDKAETRETEGADLDKYINEKSQN